MTTSTDTIEKLTDREYKYGFVTAIEEDNIPPGLNEDVIKLISSKKEEPTWLLEWRLKAFQFWKTMKEPKWQTVTFPSIDYQKIIYYSAPKKKPQLDSLEDVDPEIKATFVKPDPESRPIISSTLP